MPKISIIVPVYKVEQYLDRCVESVLAQTFKDFELILVDDGSPDNCPQMCDEWAKKDERIVVIHQENGGLSAARNTGIDWAFENSNSEWLTFIDSDDWVHPEYLERLYNAVIEHNVSVSVCGFELVEDTSDEHCDRYEVIVETTEEFHIKNSNNPIPTIAWAKLYKKEAFEDIRYPVGKLNEDEFTTYKVLFKYTKIVTMEDALYYYYQNSGSIMKSKWNYGRLAAIDAFLEQVEFYKKNGYVALERIAEDKYIRYLEIHIRNLLASDLPLEQTNEFINKYKKQAKVFLKDKKTLYTTKTNPWLYEFLYPVKMKFYWTLQGIKAKVERIFGEK